LAELRVGVVGCGRIGGAVASRLLALGAEVWANDIAPVAREGVRFVELDELLAGCDAVTLHVPLTSETRGLIGAAQIASMRHGALLVNTSRGAVVDLEAVVAALPHEPPPAVPEAPNLVLTPHAAYYSEAAEARAYRLAVARVRELLAGA